MSASPASNTPTCCHVELFSDQENLLARVVGGTTPSRPSPVPKVSSYFVEWLSAACERFWFQHQRCIGFRLLFSPSAGRWQIDLPRQTCGSDAVHWSSDAASALLPGFCIIGSYQALPSPEPVDLLPLVPGFSGMHFLHVITPGEPTIRAVLRLSDPEGPPVLLLEPSQLIANNAAAVLEHHQHRLQLI